MKQDRFAEQNEPLWQEFERLLIYCNAGERRRDRHRQKKPSPPALDVKSSSEHPPELDADVALFPQRYRQLAQHLALARARGYSLALIDRLEGLTLRGHQLLYTRRQPLGTATVAFVAGEFPRQVRAGWRSLTLSSLIFFGAMLGSAGLVAAQPEVILTLLSADQVASAEAMYDLDAKRLGRGREAGDDIAMFGFYIRNNTSIGFQTFAGGLLAGLGTAFFLLFNGLHIGALAGHLSTNGFAVPFWSFVAGHSALELSAIVISGAAGLRLGWGILRPGRHRRTVSLMLAARGVIGLVYGAAGLFALAAFVEAFWSSITTVAPMVKYTAGVGLWVALLAYILAAGRGVAEADGGR